MIDQLLSNEQLFWLVICSFYIVDNIKLVPKSHLVVRETLLSGYIPLIGFSKYELSGKEIKIPNLLLPFLTTFLLKYDPGSPLQKKDDIRTLRLIKVFQIYLRPLKVIAGLSFLLLMAGPFFALYRGFSFALALLIPIHLILVFSAVVILIKRRKKLNLTKEKTLLLILEILLVPAYLSNIARRISFNQDFHIDGYMFSVRQAKLGNLENIRHQIGKKIDLEIEELELEENDQALYLSYKNALGV